MSALLKTLSRTLNMTSYQVGAIYFWMKEITPYFLKIHGLYAALDVMNKVWSFVGMVQAHPLRA